MVATILKCCFHILLGKLFTDSLPTALCTLFLFAHRLSHRVFHVCKFHLGGRPAGAVHECARARSLQAVPRPRGMVDTENHEN